MKKLTGSACVITAVLGIFWTLPGADSLRVSDDAIQLIAEFEGCRTNAYQCSAGVWTNGIGHTKGVKRGDTATTDKIARFLIEDITDAERCVMAKLNGANMPQSVLDASASLVLNVGCQAATYNRKQKRPTFLATHATQRNWRAMCNEFGGFKYAAGKVSPGLERRRAAETKLCLSGVR